MKKFSSIIITIALLLTSVFATNAYATDIPDSNTVPVVGVYNYSQTSPSQAKHIFLAHAKQDNSRMTFIAIMAIGMPSLDWIFHYLAIRVLLL